MSPPLAPTVRLANGNPMPLLGLGTLNAFAETEKAIEIAIEHGYRLIDTAYVYQNEKLVGEAIRNKINDGTVKREELFITTKLHAQFHRKEDAKKCLQQSLADLGLDYVDLYLIHNPIPVKKVEGQLLPLDQNMKIMWDTVDHLETWGAMEEFYNAGLAKAIGLSNFSEKQIKNVYDHAKVKPMNLQVECHAYFPQFELQKFCSSLGITMTGYAPLGSPVRHPPFDQIKFPMPMDDEKVKAVAAKIGKSPAQVLIRWLMQRGISAIPKSTSPERIRQNFVTDFELSSDDMHTINNLGVNVRTLGAETLISDDCPYSPHK